MVLGEGDIKQKTNNLKYGTHPMKILDYKLKNNNKVINTFRNLYQGMPYCHNAIIFKNNLDIVLNIKFLQIMITF